MALPVDTGLTPAVEAAAPVPPESPLAMPPQALDRAPGARFARPSLRVLAARLTTFGGGAALTAYGAWQMTLVFDPTSVSALQSVLNLLFTLTFGWIALSACAALAGALFGPRPPATSSAPLCSRTAIVMPVYEEDMAEVCGALAAMGRGLARLGEAKAFEIFILSDTRSAEGWARETTAFAALRARLPEGPAVFYRRRVRNHARKAGNVQDFIERWGGRYDFMLSLDADSLMAAETIVEMARRMETEPRLGLLQTVPTLAGGDTLYARLQQFAGRLYGPPIARGVAAWQGEDGNYWGHNAMIRVRAFAGSAGLPTLRGRTPFGGHVLSHDFVEAALLRRAGWIVRMDPDLRGSWEGSPPSLAEAAARDRRWAQGNLQHLKVIGAKGLRWPNRAHFAIGVGSYLASPLWLALILVGLTLSAQAILIRPEYFPEVGQLFPNWPRFDAERMRWLFALSMALLLLPKALGLVSALARPRLRARYGGAKRLLAGAGAEIVLSALYAPVMMLIQTRQLAQILLGRDGGWSAQARSGRRVSWGEVWRRHAIHVAFGLSVAAGAAYAAPPLLLWLSPVLAGLVHAPVLSRISGDPVLGRRLKRMGLLATPDELDPRPILAEAAAETRALRSIRGLRLQDVVSEAARREAHVAALTASDASGDDRLAAITARAKIEAAGSGAEALAWLDEAERRAVLARPELLALWGDRSAVAAA